MSTMLKTTNPAAVAEIDPNRDRRVPYVGQTVIWNPRPGEGRAGLFTAPALVMRVADEDHIDLIVLWDADDFLPKRRIPRKTDQNNMNCWSFNDHDEVHYLRPVNAGGDPNVPKEVQALQSEITELRTRVAELEARKHPKPRAVTE